jgi:3-dehydroquinate dehydratase-1
MSRSRAISINGKPLAGGALPAIVTPLCGATRQEILDEVALIIPKAPDLLEWRVDFFAAIGDHQAVVDTALAIRQAAGGIPVLLTRRNASEGGEKITINEAQVVAIYCAACAARCVELIDYELSNAPENLEKLRAVSKANGVLMVMSYHNFALTPDAQTLDSRFAAAEKLGADVAKVAVMPRNAQDVLALLAATDRARQSLGIPLISMSMGGVGSHSRIIGWIYGSAATFAVGKDSSAPGQIAIDDLRSALAVVRQAINGS